MEKKTREAQEFSNNIKRYSDLWSRMNIFEKFWSLMDHKFLLFIFLSKRLEITNCERNYK